MAELSPDALLYEAILKLYRNSVVAFIRRRLRAAKGDSWEQELRIPLQKEWSQLEANAQTLRASGAVTHPLRDAADYLSVNHFQPLLERFFADLWPEHQANRELRSNVGTWAHTVKTYRDSLGHPYELDMNRNDATILLDAARRVLLLIDVSVAGQISTIEATLRARWPARPHLEPLPAYIPSRETIVVDFVGRDNILTSLHAWFADPHSSRWVLAGDGGKGKSAIAYRFAEQVAEMRPSGYAGVIWLSAKQRQYVEGAVVPARPDFTDLRGAVERLLYVYGSTPSPSLGQAIEECLEALQPPLAMLVVVDDVDSISREEEDAVEFLTIRLPATGSKVLLTSRRELFGLGKTTTVVPGLPDGEAREFIESRIRRYQLDRARFSTDAIEHMIRATDASPLYLEDLIRLCAALSPSDAVRGWEQNRGSKVREYAVSREVELLSTNGQRVLIACALSTGPVTLPELQVIAHLSEDDVFAAVEELRTLYLIPQPNLIDDLPRYVLNSNTRSLVARVYANAKVGREIRAALRNLEQRYVELEPEVTALCRQSTVYAHGGLSEKAEELLIGALGGPYPEHPRVLAQLGWLYRTWRPTPRIVDARNFFKRAFEMGNVVPNTYVSWTEMELYDGNVSAAVDAANHGLEICGRRDPRLLRVAALAASRHAAEMRSMFQEGTASSTGRRAYELYLAALAAAAASPVDDAELSRIFSGLVRAGRMVGERAQADAYLTAWGERLPDDPYFRAEAAKGLVTRHGR
ncbi:MAG: hypothetical protein ACRENX_09690 [Candidatus Dormibacteria bacterium]